MRPSCERTSTARGRKRGRLPGPRAQPRGPEHEVHATVDALGNPTGFHLTPGQASDLEGADALLPGNPADGMIGDRAFDAQRRVIEPLLAAGKTMVSPSTRLRRLPRERDRHP